MNGNNYNTVCAIWKISLKWIYREMVSDKVEF